MSKRKECVEHELATDHEKGETFCVNCGAVVEEQRLQTEAEWKPK